MKSSQSKIRGIAGASMIAVVASIIAVSQGLRARDLFRGYHETDAFVTESGTRLVSKSTVVAPYIKYVYTVADQEMAGQDDLPTPTNYSQGQAERIAAVYVKGTPVRIAYSERTPRLSVLAHSRRAAATFSTAVGVVFGVITAACLAAALIAFKRS